VMANPMLQRLDLRGALRALGPPKTPRVILLPGSYFSFDAQRYLQGAVPYYLPLLTAGATLRAREIDIITARPQPGLRPCLAGQTCQILPFRAPPGQLWPGFHLVSRQTVQVFTATRWRTAEPVVIPLARLMARGPSVSGIAPVAYFQP
jgi:hypothetical protein